MVKAGICYAGKICHWDDSDLPYILTHPTHSNVAPFVSFYDGPADTLSDIHYLQKKLLSLGQQFLVTSLQQKPSFDNR